MPSTLDFLKEVLDFIDDFMERNQLRPTQQIDTLLMAIEDDLKNEDEEPEDDEAQPDDEDEDDEDEDDDEED